jgi:DNA-binding transcriptional regulator YhcF (GntR family)
MKEEDGGWIKLHRKLLDNPLFQRDPTAIHVFLFLLLFANRQGICTIGRSQLELHTGIKKMTAYKALKRLEKCKMVNTSSNNLYTEVSICNWSIYQSTGNNLVNKKVTAREQPSNSQGTLNKKEKENIYISPEEMKRVAELKSVDLKAVENAYINLIDYCEAKGIVYSNYVAALRNFVQRDINSGKLKVISSTKQIASPF